MLESAHLCGAVSSQKGIALETVTAPVGWSAECTFATYYKKDIEEGKTCESLYVAALISDSCYSNQLLLLVCDKTFRFVFGCQ